MWRAIRRLDWTHKKDGGGQRAERGRARRLARSGCHARPAPPHQFVFVDESSTHTALTRRYGWAPHDQRASGSAPRNHGKNTTLVAMLTPDPDGLQKPWLLVEGAMNTESFEWYIREQVTPRLQPGQSVVMDNLSAHKAASIREALAACGCDLLFLPPYPPDFSTIEQAFSKLKAILRGLGARTQETLQAAVRLAVAAITSADVAAWYAHAGYPLPAQPI